MPTIFHQLILQFIFKAAEVVRRRPTNLGIVVLTGYKVRLRVTQISVSRTSSSSRPRTGLASRSNIAKRPTS